MDNYMKITYYLHYEKEVKDDIIKRLMTPLKLKLQEHVTDETVLNELEEELTNCLCEARDYFAIDGMKLARKIEKGEYTPTI